MDPLNSVDIKSTITGSVTDTFETMFSMEVMEKQFDSIPDLGQNKFAGVVKFAGQMVGIVSIQISYDMAYELTAAMLEVEVDEIDDVGEIKDLIAEMSNIIGGKLKSSYTDIGLYCELSPPSVTTGKDFSIKSLSMEKFETFVFSYQDHLIIVETGVKQGTAESDQFKDAQNKDRRKNIDVEKYNEIDLKSHITDSVIDVFETMLSMKVSISDEIQKESLKEIRTVGSVNFAGDITGVINIHVSHELAKYMTASMLGMEKEELEGEEEINDLIGELSNIVGGGLKSTYTDVNLICELSTPSITTGSDFIIESLNMTSYERFAFKYRADEIFVEVGVKVSDVLAPEQEARKEIHYEINESESEPSDQIEQSVETSEILTPESTESSKKAIEAAQEVKSVYGPIDETGGAVRNEVDSDKDADAENLVDMDVIMDIPINISVELGRTKMPIHELLTLVPGSAVSLSRLEGEPVDILANNLLIARGVVVVKKEKYGIQITEITSRLDRIKSLG